MLHLEIDLCAIKGGQNALSGLRIFVKGCSLALEGFNMYCNRGTQEVLSIYWYFECVYHFLL